MEESTNEKEERGSDMVKITFANQFEGVARGLIPQMVEKGLNAIEIPDSDGQVLVKEDSEEYKERIDDTGVVMLPMKVRMENDTVVTFYVCSC